MFVFEFRNGHNPVRDQGLYTFRLYNESGSFGLSSLSKSETDTILFVIRVCIRFAYIMNPEASDCIRFRNPKRTQSCS